MGVNNDNPCPVCKSVKSDYWGNSIFVCRGCENVFNNENNTWKFNGTGKQPETIEHNCYSCSMFNGGCGVNRALKYDFTPCDIWEQERSKG